MTTSQTSTVADAGRRTDRIFNFSAGPATLPEECIRQAQEDLWNIDGSGIGILEHSHRGRVFDRVLQETEADCRALGGISDEYDVLFLQGGATLQFAMVPMTFLAPGKTADYLDTGAWTQKAIKEAKLFGGVNVVFDGSASDYDHTPADDEYSQTPDAAYLYYCSNNTIYGTRYAQAPKTGAPLIADTSSEMFSRPFDIGRHALIFAGAQKNLGPAGVTLVIIRKDFMASGRKDLPLLLNYSKIAEKDSCLNTPPTFGIYFMGRVFKWLLDQGGLEAISRHNEEKASLIYDVIDELDFYGAVARPDSRSVMNICFRTPSEDLDRKFVAEAAEHGMDGLKGHRSVGGLRASVYNAFPKQGCEALAQFMRDFAQRNG